MCGRFVIAGNKATIRDAFSVIESFEDELKPSWNAAPMQGIPFVSEQLREGELVRRLEIAHWGLVPVWFKDSKVGARMIDARSETVTEKPSFRVAAAKRSALVPANGYYEWQKNEDGTKIPHYLHGEDEEQLLGFAGLCEFWLDPTKPEDADDMWLETATILTRAAHDTLGHIHDRTPVIIPTDLQDQWLDPTMTERDQVRHFTDTIPEPNLVPRIVGREVGSVRSNGPEPTAPLR
ncbi:SOS response-associated peptidase [Arthrobacter sp. B0490]|uniref:SOS response-associated peptidase n=1 Tax=Arthrobacter sp. B0490 TaxID=2058891 RepID=UPI000CE3DB2E|nr:SOS response-associated peptidase [Arthrobacter sp. B0490]